MRFSGISFTGVLYGPYAMSSLLIFLPVRFLCWWNESRPLNGKRASREIDIEGVGESGDNFDLPSKFGSRRGRLEWEFQFDRKSRLHQ